MKAFLKVDHRGHGRQMEWLGVSYYSTGRRDSQLYLLFVSWGDLLVQLRQLSWDRTRRGVDGTETNERRRSVGMGRGRDRGSAR